MCILQSERFSLLFFTHFSFYPRMNWNTVSVYIKPLNINTSDFLGMYLKVANICGSGKVEHVWLRRKQYVCATHVCVRVYTPKKDECTVYQIQDDIGACISLNALDGTSPLHMYNSVYIIQRIPHTMLRFTLSFSQCVYRPHVCNNRRGVT